MCDMYVDVVIICLTICTGNIIHVAVLAVQCICVDVGDGFDWAAYLREGIELPSYSDTDSEVYIAALSSVLLHLSASFFPLLSLSLYTGICTVFTVIRRRAKN